MTCPNTHRCPIFPRFKTGALRVLRTIYCDEDFVRCARYVRISSGIIPAPTLLPNGSHLSGADSSRLDHRTTVGPAPLPSSSTPPGTS